MHNDIDPKKFSTKPGLKACIGTFSYYLGIINFILVFVFAVSSSLCIVYCRNFKTFFISPEMILLPFEIALVSQILFGLSATTFSFFVNTSHKDNIKFKKAIIIHCIASAVVVLYLAIFSLAIEQEWIPFGNSDGTIYKYKNFCPKNQLLLPQRTEDDILRDGRIDTWLLFLELKTINL